MTYFPTRSHSLQPRWIDQTPPQPEAHTHSPEEEDDSTFQLECDYLLKQCVNLKLVTVDGQVIENKGLIPPLSLAAQRATLGFLDYSQLGQFVDKIRTALTNEGITTTHWTLGGLGVLSLLKRSEYLSDAFHSLHIDSHELFGEFYWETRTHELTSWEIEIFCKTNAPYTFQTLCTKLDVPEMTIEPTQHGMRCIYTPKGFPSAVVHIQINRPVKTIPQQKTPCFTISGKTGELSLSPTTWQMLWDLLLRNCSFERFSSIFGLVDLYTQGERPLQKGIEKWTARSMEPTVPPSFLDHVRRTNIQRADDRFLLALQFLITANLTDEESLCFLRTTNFAVQNPLFKEIQKLVVEEKMPFSGIGALLELSAFCKLYTVKNDQIPSVVHTKVHGGIAIRSFYGYAQRSLLLPCRLKAAIQTVLISFPDEKHTEILLPLWNMLFLTAPLEINRPVQKMYQEDAVTLEAFVDRLKQSNCTIISQIGLIVSLIISPTRNEKALIADLVKVLPLAIPHTLHTLVVRSIEQLPHNNALHFFAKLQEHLANAQQGTVNWPLQIAKLLLEDHNIETRLIALPFVSQALRNGQIEALIPGKILLEDLINKRAITSANRLISALIEHSPEIKFDHRLLYSACRFANQLLNKGEDHLAPLGLLLISLMQRCELPHGYRDEARGETVIRLIPFLHSLPLATDLLLQGVEAKLLQGTTCQLPQVVFSLCQAWLQAKQPDAVSAGTLWQKTYSLGIWERSIATAQLYVQLIHKLQETKPSRLPALQEKRQQIALQVEEALINEIGRFNPEELVNIVPEIAKLNNVPRLHLATIAKCQPLPEPLLKLVIEDLTILRKNSSSVLQ